MRHHLVGGLGLILALGQPAAAQTPSDTAANRADLQCVAVAAATTAMSEGNPTVQTGAAAAMMFYLGRLEGRSPGVDWLERFRSYLLSSNMESEMKTNLERCAREMMVKGDALIKFGTEMEALGDKVS